MSDLSELQQKVFKAWAGMDRDFSIISFATTANRSGVDMKHIRRTVRALARKGYLEFCQSAWSDEGEMCGAGYGLTDKGEKYWRDETE